MLAKIVSIKNHMVIWGSKSWQLDFNQALLWAPHFEITPVPTIQW